MTQDTLLYLLVQGHVEIASDRVTLTAKGYATMLRLRAVRP